MEIRPKTWYEVGYNHGLLGETKLVRFPGEQSWEREEYERGYVDGAALFKEKGVGDLTSTEPGTGARFNAGKPKMEFVPLHSICSMLRETPVEKPENALAVLNEAAAFEAGDNSAIYRALRLLNWADTCAVFEYGARKYATWNWAKGMKWSVPLACIKRHAVELAAKRLTDDESGLPHMGHIGCNVVMLAHFERYYRDLDDRPPPYVFHKQGE